MNKSYVLSTSIGTFKLRKPLDFEALLILQTEEDNVTFTVESVTETGMDSLLCLNLKEVTMLGYYEIDEEEEKEEDL